MILPVYNFYIGKSINVNIIGDTSIDDYGNSIVYENYMSTSKIQISSNLLYINSNLCDSYTSIFYYDKNSQFINSSPVNCKNIISIPDNSHYIAFRFSNSDGLLANNAGNELMYFIHEVVPVYNSLSKKYSKESGQEFFRESIDGKIYFIGTDYEYINNSYIEDNFIFVICKDTKYNVYYKGSFTKIDCSFEHDSKKCEVKLNTIDEYTKILNGYKNTYDIIKIAPAISQITYSKRPLIQIYVSGSNYISNFMGGTHWDDEVNSIIYDYNTLLKTYHFSLSAKANEFYIAGANIEEVNGLYCGLDDQIKNGDYSFVTMLVDPYNNLYKMWIEKSGEILYQSIGLIQGNDLVNKTVELVNTFDSSDVCAVEKAFTYHIYTRLLCNVDYISDSQGDKSTYDLPIEDISINRGNYTKCIGIAHSDFIYIYSVSNSPTKYGLNPDGLYYSNPHPYYEPNYRVLPVCKNIWARASLWFLYNKDAFYENPIAYKTLNDSWAISDIIKSLLNEIDPSIKHEATQEYSQFLYGPKIPITPILNFNRFYVYITQKTNILKSNYEQPAQKAEITLEDITNMLRDCFRCYWFIENNMFRIEHVYYFINGGSYEKINNVQIDFTKINDQFNKKNALYFQSSVEYDKSDLFKRYEFSWMDSCTELFDGEVLDVESNYVQKDSKENIAISKFSSDIDYMIAYPSEFSNDGFALLCPLKDENNKLYIPIIEANYYDENKIMFDAKVQNIYASWRYLIGLYLYDMPAKNIKSFMSGDIIAKNVKMCKKHTIEFQCEDDPDVYKFIRTSIGDGKINEMTINLDTRIVKANLIYNL